MEIECPGTASEIYGKLKTKFDAFRKASNIGQYIKDVTFNDSSHSVQATGTGFKADIECRDGKIVADLNLSFLLKAIRPQIEDGIRKNIARAIS